MLNGTIASVTVNYSFILLTSLLFRIFLRHVNEAVKMLSEKVGTLANFMTAKTIVIIT